MCRAQRLTASAVDSAGCPGIVLLPGLDGSGRLFDELVRRAPGDVATQVVSYPATTPLSYSETCDWVASRLPSDRPFVLVAESYSGPVAILLAARRPEQLCGVVLCNSFALRPAWGALAQLPWSVALAHRPPAAVIGLLLVGWAERRGWVERVRAAVAAATPAALAARLRSVFSVDVRAELAATTVPLLVLRGSRDRLVSAASAARIVAARPDATFAVLDGPHLLLQLRPAACWQAMRPFLERAGSAMSPPPA